MDDIARSESASGRLGVRSALLLAGAILLCACSQGGGASTNGSATQPPQPTAGSSVDGAGAPTAEGTQCGGPACY